MKNSKFKIKKKSTGYWLLVTGYFRRRRDGFTLLELLIVIAIIAVLIAMGLVSYIPAQKKARDSKRKAELEQIRSALEMHRADVGSYPDSVECDGTIEDGENTYMDPVPCDPKDSGDYIYNYIPSLDNLAYTLGANLEATDESAGTCTMDGYEYCVKNP